MATKRKKKAKKKVTRKRRLRAAVKKAPKKKSSARKKKTAKKKSLAAGVPKKQVLGVVTHYFPKVNAAVVKLKKPLAVGDTIVLKGKTTHFEQRVESMQIDHVPIQTAKKGDEIGLQVSDRVREHDLVLLPT